MATRAEQIAKAAAAAVADYRRKQAQQTQEIWCLVSTETGMLDFSGQFQIASVPVFESQQDAESEMDNYELDEKGYKIRQATLTFAPEAPAAEVPTAAPTASAKKAESPSMGVYETGLQRYPEFDGLVKEIVVSTIRMIQAKADKIQSKMPYKQQFVLEEVIRELQERV